QNRSGGRPAVLGVVEGALDVILVRADVHGAVVLWAGLLAGTSGEVRHFRQGDVDLDRGARVIDAPHRLGKVGRQGARIEQLLKRQVRIEIAGDLGGTELVAVLEGDAGRLAVVRQDFGDLG